MRTSISVVSYAGSFWSISSNFSKNLHCVSQTKIAKNSLKTRIFGVQGRSR